MLRQEAAAPKPQRSEVEVYTGSIVIVPTRGDHCWQMMLDNRTGQMWEKGYVNCDEAVSRPEKDPRRSISAQRLNSIGKAFNRGGIK